MPGKITTVDEALNVVRMDPRALERLPEELKTPEVCLAAVQDDIKGDLACAGNTQNAGILSCRRSKAPLRILVCARGTQNVGTLPGLRPGGRLRNLLCAGRIEDA